MLQGVFLLNEAGETIISLGNKKLEGDSSMIGGLVGAIQMFVHKMVNDDVKSITFEDMLMYMRKVGQNHVVTLHDVNDVIAELQSQRIAKFIEENTAIGYSEGFIKLISTMLSSDED